MISISLTAEAHEYKSIYQLGLNYEDNEVLFINHIILQFIRKLSRL